MRDHKTSKFFVIRAFNFYVEGFRSMSKTSRTLWVIILIKLFVMFAILKLFFFPNIIKSQGDKQQQQEYVIEQFTQ